jgi:hypothetical protein
MAKRATRSASCRRTASSAGKSPHVQHKSPESDERHGRSDHGERLRADGRRSYTSRDRWVRLWTLLPAERPERIERERHRRNEQRRPYPVSLPSDDRKAEAARTHRARPAMTMTFGGMVPAGREHPCRTIGRDGATDRHERAEYHGACELGRDGLLCSFAASIVQRIGPARCLLDTSARRNF